MVGSALGMKRALSAALALAMSMTGAAARAQAIDSDLAKDNGQTYSEPYPDPESGSTGASPADQNGTPMDGGQASPGAAAPAAGTGVPVSDPSAAASEAAGHPATAVAQGGTYKKDDLIGAAEGVFGKGAEGLARMIETWLAKQGEPNAYIVGREGGGALVFGLRYGSGTLYHKVEGERPVYWTGPSVGFDVGANAGSTFVLVYNLYDTQDLYKRFPAGEGQAYVVGGLTASYMRSGDVVLIPIRMGAGLRLGINAGYMKFSKKQKWIPF